MNWLTEPLPTSVFIGRQRWAISTDFSVGIRFELTMQDDTLSHQEKLRQALALYYPKVPMDLQGAVDALLWFYRCGADLPTATTYGQSKKSYCFDQDKDLIYAAFWQVYGIDLTQEGLHWWVFRALFVGLPEECMLRKIMGYRTADLKNMGKSQKKQYEKLRKHYALQNRKTVRSAISLAERNQRMQDYVHKRFVELEKG